MAELPPAVQAALEAARHELTTLDGLWVHDGQPPDAPETWQIDTTRTLAQIEAVLGLPSAAGPVHRPAAQMIQRTEITL